MLQHQVRCLDVWLNDTIKFIVSCLTAALDLTNDTESNHVQEQHHTLGVSRRARDVEFELSLYRRVGPDLQGAGLEEMNRRIDLWEENSPPFSRVFPCR
jgi:hypothetical protein